jgi:four helix bundle protein
MATAHQFEELICWQLANRLKTQIYLVAARPPFRANRRLRDQICEAAASATSNIAEGFGRYSNAEFLYLLDVARGSLNECQDRLNDARMRGYVDEREYRELLGLSRRAGGATGGLQRYLRGRLRRRGKAGIPQSDDKRSKDKPSIRRPPRDPRANDEQPSNHPPPPKGKRRSNNPRTKGRG